MAATRAIAFFKEYIDTSQLESGGELAVDEVFESDRRGKDQGDSTDQEGRIAGARLTGLTGDIVGQLLQEGHQRLNLIVLNDQRRPEVVVILSRKRIQRLNDENGNEVEFEFLDLIPYRQNEYVVLLPIGDSDGQVVILQLKEIDDETEEYVGVENEFVLETVFALFKERNKDFFTFE